MAPRQRLSKLALLTIGGLGVFALGFGVNVWLMSQKPTFTAEERRLGLHCLDRDSGFHTAFLADVTRRLPAHTDLAAQKPSVEAVKDNRHEIVQFFRMDAQDGLVTGSFDHTTCIHELTIVRVG